MTAFSSLPRSFFEPAADIVAEALLGHWLVRNTPAGPCGGAIVETEAYLTGDAASHSFRGETKRNRAVWGHPGHSYVYFIYGNHYCFNVVCRPAGIGEAVLVRALEPTIGLDLMRARRPVTDVRQLTNGPGKLCAAMDIDRSLDGVDLCDVNSPLFIAENKNHASFLRQYAPRIITKRIGITQATDLPLRFYLDGSEFISRRLAAAKTQALHCARHDIANDFHQR